MAYLQGNVAVSTVSFTVQATGAAIDPTTVTVKYSINGGAFSAPITYAGASSPAVGVVARLGAGQYQVQIDTTGIASGPLVFLWQSTGTGQAAVEDAIPIGVGAGGGGPTLGDLIDRVYLRVTGGTRERTVLVNQTGGIGPFDATLVLSGAQCANIAAGMKLAIDLEEMLVESWAPSGTTGGTATIVRGFNGSPQAAHSNGQIVFINPRYTRFAIAQAINDDLRSMSSPVNGVFRVGTLSFNYNYVFMGYDLGAAPPNFLGILDVFYRDVYPSHKFPQITNYDVRRMPGGVTDAQFPSGQGIVLYETAFPGLPVYVVYAAPFLKLVSETDSVLSTPATNDEAPPYNGYTLPLIANLTATQVDIPVLGAIATLTMAREIPRNVMESQPEPRKAQEVPPGAITNSGAAILNLRAQRIREEADRLARQYPLRRMV